MALLLFEGFESGSGPGPWGTPDYATTGVRAGTGEAYNGEHGELTFTFENTHDTLIIGMAIRPLGTSWSQFHNYLKLQAGTQQLANITFYAIADLAVKVAYGDSNSNIVAEGGGMTQDWYYVEIKIDTATGDIVVRIDGVVVIDESPGALDAFTDPLNFFWASNSDNLFLDDVYVCDGAGAENNDFLGDVRIFPITTAADGTHSDWAPDTGTDHEARVDQLSADDFANGYVRSTAAAERDSYTVTALGELPEGFDVKAISLDPSLLNQTGDPVDVDAFVRIGTTDYDNGNVQTPGASPGRKQYRWLQNPDTAAAWTQADIEAMEIGVVSA